MIFSHLMLMQQLKVKRFNLLVLWLLHCRALAKRPATFDKRVKELVSKLPELEFCLIFFSHAAFVNCVNCHNALFFSYFPPSHLCREETLLSTDSSGNSSDNGCTSPVDMIKRPNVVRHDRQSSTERWEQVYSNKFTVTEALFVSTKFNWTVATMIQRCCHQTVKNVAESL